MKYIRIAASKDEIRHLRELFRMISSVPMDMSFDEAILYVKHSIKLLPAVKSHLPNHDR